MAKRGKGTIPPIEPKSFASADEIDRGIAKLRRRIRDVEKLKESKAEASTQAVKNVESDIQETTRDVFGHNSPEFREYQYYKIWKGGYSWADDDEYSRQSKFEAGIPETLTMLEGLITRLEEKKEDLLPIEATGAPTEKPPPSPKQVFVVHGRDEGVKQAVARFLEKLDLQPIILHEQPSKGRTIIEKFEEYSDVAYAIVLFTGDDRGGLKDAPPDKYKLRARQNVILELGFFLGRLGRRRVCCLYRESVEVPSDYQGVVYVGLDDAGAWKLTLAKEMKAAGLDVDLNKI